MGGDQRRAEGEKRGFGGTLTFADLVSRGRTHPFEIEHIWADKPERHPEFESEQAFWDQRNKLGGLLLLPKDSNASFGANPYPAKLALYFGQNALAKSLHPNSYQNNPTFLRVGATSIASASRRSRTSSRWRRSRRGKRCIASSAR